jgi:hypothetical protein
MPELAGVGFTDIGTGTPGTDRFVVCKDGAGGLGLPAAVRSGPVAALHLLAC